MQDFQAPFKNEQTNFTPPERKPLLLQISFIVDIGLTQPTVIYRYSARTWMPDPSQAIIREDVEVRLAKYVEKTAGTEFDLDRSLEAASIEHLLSTNEE